MKITILGAGAFGTAIAHVCSHVQNASVCLWARNEEVVNSINLNGINSKTFSNYKFKPNVFATNNMENALNKAEFVHLF